MKLSHNMRLSLAINLWLLLLVLGTALLLVRWQYESRRLYVALEKADNVGKHLDGENARALADKRQLSSPARIERVAAQNMGMKPAEASVTLYLERAP